MKKDNFDIHLDKYIVRLHGEILIANTCFLILQNMGQLNRLDNNKVNLFFQFIWILSVNTCALSLIKIFEIRARDSNNITFHKLLDYIDANLISLSKSETGEFDEKKEKVIRKLHKEVKEKIKKNSISILKLQKVRDKNMVHTDKSIEPYQMSINLTELENLLFEAKNMLNKISLTINEKELSFEAIFLKGKDISDFFSWIVSKHNQVNEVSKSVTN